MTLLLPFALPPLPTLAAQKFRMRALKPALASQTPSPSPKVKRAVPSSPGVIQSLRGLGLACPLLETQAVEVDADGESQSGSENSEDDRHLSNLSCVTDGTDVPHLAVSFIV